MKTATKFNTKPTLFNQMINKLVRTVYPTFRQENPYVYRFETRLQQEILMTYKRELLKNRRKFSFQNQNYSLNHQQKKLANKVFWNTDKNNTLVGCFEVIINSLKENKLRKFKNLRNDLYLFIKFITFAFSPLLNAKHGSKNHVDAEIVRYFFLYLGTRILDKYDANFLKKYFTLSENDNVHLKQHKLSDYLLSTYKKSKELNHHEPFSFHIISDYLEKLNGAHSKLRQNLSRHQSFNYYNYSTIIMETYLFCKNLRKNKIKKMSHSHMNNNTNNTENFVSNEIHQVAKTGYLLGLSLMIKLELALKLTKKSSLRTYSTLTNDTYNGLAFFNNEVFSQLQQSGASIEPNIELLLKIMSESENKLWLKDEPKMSPSTIIALCINYAFMIIWAIVILYPLALIIKLTFNEASLYTLNTTIFTFSWTNFEFLFKETLFLDWTANTFIVAFATAFIVTVFCSLLAYAYSRFEFKGKKTSIGGVMIFQMIPAGLALVVFIVYGKYFTDELELENAHLLILIIIYSGGAIAGNTFLLKGYMDTISPDVFDAARIDGCSHMKVFWTITIPLAKPMMAVIFLWSFIGPFFDFLLPSILSGNVQENLTMAAGLQTLLIQSTSGVYSPGAYAAGGLLVAVPFAILFLSLNKQIVSGLTAGAVK